MKSNLGSIHSGFYNQDEQSYSRVVYLTRKKVEQYEKNLLPGILKRRNRTARPFIKKTGFQRQPFDPFRVYEDNNTCNN
jgi:hypothetical protein